MSYSPPDPREPGHDAVHGMFGLTYANYPVLPRSVLQAMPADWQVSFADLMERLATAADEAGMVFDPPGGYRVQPLDSSGRFAPHRLHEYRHAPRDLRRLTGWDRSL